jgi:hypothetical protein
MIYPVHVQERFARLLKQRADQSRKAKVAPATLGKVPVVPAARRPIAISARGLALLYPALGWGSCAPGHYGYPRASDLILG